MAAQLAEAAETTASHLHPRPSFDLADHPVPNGREEVWRFTPLPRLQALLQPRVSGQHLAWEAHLPVGVTTRTLAPEEARGLVVEAPIDRVSAVAEAGSGGAVLLDIPAQVELGEAVQVTLSGTAGQVVHSHLIVRAGAFSKATVVLRYQGSGSLAEKIDVLVGDGASVTFVTIQDWADDAVHGGHSAVLVGRDAHVRTIAVSLGGSLVRLAETAKFAGPGGALEQFGLYFVDAGQHIEHRLFVDHNAPNTRSNVDFRGALQGRGARSVWVGDVLIRKVAEGINTYESNKNLLLTEGCRADSVPNLEIETGQIEGAGHSSTTGRFDDEQLFYLRSRGISEEEARRLVVHGFFADIIRRIGVPEVEAHMLAAIEKELAVSVGVPTR